MPLETSELNNGVAKAHMLSRKDFNRNQRIKLDETDKKKSLRTNEENFSYGVNQDGNQFILETSKEFENDLLKFD